MVTLRDLMLQQRSQNDGWFSQLGWILNCLGDTRLWVYLGKSFRSLTEEARLSLYVGCTILGTYSKQRKQEPGEASE